MERIKNCEECTYKKDLLFYVDTVKIAVKQMDDMVNQIEELGKQRLLLNYKMVCQKKMYEKALRQYKYIPDNPKVMISKNDFYKKLLKTSIMAKESMMLERQKMIEEASSKYAGTRVLFVLPTASSCGGASIIISEAAAMREFGVDAKIINIEAYKKDFMHSYSDFNVPFIFVSNLMEVGNYVNDFDIICATSFNTVSEANFCELEKHVKVAYYIQDFEPDFFEKSSPYYNVALESYSLVSNMHCVTKTNWNKDMVKNYTGVDCSLMMPTVHLDLLSVDNSEHIDKDKLSLTAMIRPDTPRRRAAETMQILQNIFWKYGNKVEINIFGAFETYEGEFFVNEATDFDFINHGMTVPKVTAEILKKTDIFVDFSKFQAMGLTAMEAMASGCAVIVPKNGGATSYAENEHNALVVDSASIDECMQALSRLIEDGALRERISLQAVQDIYEYYPHRCAAKFLDIVLDA